MLHGQIRFNARNVDAIRSINLTVTFPQHRETLSGATHCQGRAMSSGEDLRECTLSKFVSSRTAPHFLDAESLHDGSTENTSLSAEKVQKFQDEVSRIGSVCVLLAAGQGSRFVSDTPKVIYPFEIAGTGSRPLAAFSIAAASSCGMPIVAIVGHARERVVKTLYEHYPKDYPIVFLVQEEQMGTGHAVYLAKFALPDNFAGEVLVTYADNPGVDAELLKQVFGQHEALKQKHGDSYGCLILTGSRKDAGQGAAAYGRIVRQKKEEGPVVDIVEKKTILALKRDMLVKVYEDAAWTPEELEDIDEFNSGIVIARSNVYMAVLGNITASQTKFDPPKYEYYATDFVKGLVGIGKITEGWQIPRESIWKLEGANTVEELRELEQKSNDRLKQTQG